MKVNEKMSREENELVALSSVSLNHVKKKKTFSWFEFDMWNVFPTLLARSRVEYESESVDGT